MDAVGGAIDVANMLIMEPASMDTSIEAHLGQLSEKDWSILI